VVALARIGPVGVRELLGLGRLALPPAVQAAMAWAAPNPALLWVMDRLFGRALLPLHASCADAWTDVAHFALYVRGNWLRMPPLLLARHLFHKAFITKHNTSQAA